MMKVGKEEEKIMNPMFPRLHVNDTDKGGPRAPPRNKMALYEQLSIPSHRFNSTAASVLPLPPHNASILVSTASSQGDRGWRRKLVMNVFTTKTEISLFLFSKRGRTALKYKLLVEECGHERSVSSPYYTPSDAPVHNFRKVHSHSSNGKIPPATIRKFKRPARHGNQRSSHAASSIADCNLLHPHDVYDRKNSSEEDDDFRVPTFIHSEFAKCSSKNMLVKEMQKSSASGVKEPAESYSCTVSSSAQLSNFYDKPLEQKSACVANSRKHETNHSEKEHRETRGIKEQTEEFAFHPENGEKISEPSVFSKAFLDHECIRIRNAIDKTCSGNTERSQESSDNGCLGELRCLESRDVMENGDARLRSGCCSKSSPRNSHRDANMADNCYLKLGDKAGVSLELGDGDRNGEMSDTSMDSIAGLNISLDEVVGVIGPKQFWTVRTAIINQQRIFALQLFELHRLIKVQKLLAASPHLLLGDNHGSNNSMLELPTKNLPAESNVELQPLTEQKDNVQEQNQNIKCPTEKRGVHPSPSPDGGLSKELDQLPSSEPCSGKPPAVPVAPDNSPGPWCFQPPANQWLVPVMSPTEGLIYKPYSGFCPPSAGFMAPIYGGCGPMQLQVGGDFMNQAYGVPATHQQLNMGTPFRSPGVALNYFPAPYGLPVVNPVIPTSVVEQVSPLTRPMEQTEQHSQSSCNMLNLKNEAFGGCSWKLNASKDCELQGSTASSPCERVQGEGRDALDHPVAPLTKRSRQLLRSNESDYQTHVIKVVPHNASSATESAARIFRSIQEERRQLDI
ncbi:protein HEADING DATE 3B isoform X2 [Elaeis guineensis]|uniref:protein HEADING DATE 3B isoform X2 n=1 Tax=Elaeis guineensis var. tenera TaxID=51953 RepID=UPI003C6DA4F9